MSSATVANTLVSILPTYTISTLPKPLHDTASALLAQSRSRVPTLKAEEEPARAWACAEIAIKRLQTRLNLPSIAQNPPCPPRIYKKLYQYLDRALLSGPPARNRSSGPPTPQKSGERVARGVVTTPSKTSASNIQNPAPNGLINKRKLDRGISGVEILPSWLGPTITHLCKTFSASAATAHVFVGVVSVLHACEPAATNVLQTPAKIMRTASACDVVKSTSQDGNKPDSEVLNIIVAVIVLVLDKMELRSSHAQPSPKADCSVSNIRAAVQELVALGRLSISQAGSVGAAVKRLLEQQTSTWLAMDWWDGVPDGLNDQCQPTVNLQLHDYGDNSGIAESMTEQGALIGANDRGLGAIDWLSEQRREDYRLWEINTLKRIDRIDSLQTK